MGKMGKNHGDIGETMEFTMKHECGALNWKKKMDIHHQTWGSNMGIFLWDFMGSTCKLLITHKPSLLADSTITTIVNLVNKKCSPLVRPSKLGSAGRSST